VIGDKLYVAGGWELIGGTNKPIWPSNALVLDLAHPQTGWKTFPQPFQRRALALAALDGRLYCIGGMDPRNEPSLAVDIYDTTSGAWTHGPSLPDGELKGFACSAMAHGGRIYVTAMKGDLWRLSMNGQAWETVGRLAQPRIAHRLVTAGNRQLIVLGGEDGQENKTPDLELLTPSEAPPVLTEVSPQTPPVLALHPQ
jgi:N-acetylneuraminic acid mutarotase